jgi:uncharacterized protein with FMN-binding domain
VSDNRNSQKTIAAFGILFAVALIATGEIIYTHRKTASDSAMVATSVNKPATTDTSTSTTASPSGFKDGTYKATGDYESPGGSESITISVTLANGVVSSSSAQSGANDLTAKEYQSDFIQNYKTQVVGKNIGDIKLSRVSGSSLTSQGFNNALTKIRTQAQS